MRTGGGLLVNKHLSGGRPARLLLVMVAAAWLGAAFTAGGAAGAEAQSEPQSEPSSADERAPAAGVDAPIEDENAPLYSPFTARYLLDEIKQLRIDVERTRADLIERQVQREYEIAKDAAGYARHAVELFFFVITAVTTLLVFFGWNSLRDIRVRVSQIAETRVGSLVEGYAERLDAIEEELQQKSKRLKAAQLEIDETNEIHSLWLRASQETEPAAKIAVYDDILKMRPEDTEAMTFKADAALQLGQSQWALSLANRAIDIDGENAHALYQRACAQTSIGAVDEAIADLATAIGMVDTYRRQASTDPAFASIRDADAFKALIDREDLTP